MLDPRPFVDNAKNILASEPSLDNHERAALWERFHDSKTAQDLAARLSDLDVPNHIVESLIAAKKLQEPEAPATADAPKNPTIDALEHMQKISPAVLALAEKCPIVMGALLKNAK
jgi:hypothetical protein